MTTLQPFKSNDLIEPKVRDCYLPTLSELGEDRDDFYNGAYTAYPLGDVLYVLKRDPMADIISQNSFRTSFFAIHQLFTRPGTFDFYLDVFKAIFGEDVVVEFTVPSPGVLLINVQVLNVQTYRILARRIENDAYVYEPLIDREGDYILERELAGIKTQREIDNLIFELAPQGIWTRCTLVVS